MVEAWSPIQVAWAGRTEELLALGLPDWRAPFLAGRSPMSSSGPRDQLTAGERATARPFPRRPARPPGRGRGCGLPDTLVHGDFAPGNVRGDGPAAP